MNYDKHYSIENYYKVKEKLKEDLFKSQPKHHSSKKHNKQKYRLKNKWLWTKNKKGTSPLEERLDKAFTNQILHPYKQYEIQIITKSKTYNFKVDFCFPDEKLVIECDGNTYHGNQGTLWSRQDYEARRHYLIKKQGYKILRYTTDDIHNKSDIIARHIKETLKIIRFNESNKPNELNLSSEKTMGHNIGNGLQTVKNQTPGEFLACLPVDVMNKTRSRESSRTTGGATIASSKNSSLIKQTIRSNRLDGAVRFRQTKSDKEIADYKNQLCEARKTQAIKSLTAKTSVVASVIVGGGFGR